MKNYLRIYGSNIYSRLYQEGGMMPEGEDMPQDQPEEAPDMEASDVEESGNSEEDLNKMIDEFLDLEDQGNTEESCKLAREILLILLEKEGIVSNDDQGGENFNMEDQGGMPMDQVGMGDQGTEDINEGGAPMNRLGGYIGRPMTALEKYLLKNGNIY